MLRSTSQSNKLRTKAKVMNEGLVRSLGEFPSYWGGDGVVLGTPTRSMFSHVVSSNLAVQVNERQAKLEVSFYHYCCLRGARVFLSLRHVGSSDSRTMSSNTFPPRVAPCRCQTAPLTEPMNEVGPTTHRSMCLRQVSQRRNKEVEQGKTLFEEEGLWGSCQRRFFQWRHCGQWLHNDRIHARKLDVDFEGVLCRQPTRIEEELL